MITGIVSTNKEKVPPKIPKKPDYLVVLKRNSDEGVLDSDPVHSSPSNKLKELLISNSVSSSSSLPQTQSFFEKLHAQHMEEKLAIRI